jgi:uncharacterized protein DUF4240
MAYAKPMGAARFWRFIDLMDWTKRNDDAIMRPVIEELSHQTVPDINGFEETMAHKLFSIDGEPWARKIGRYAYKGDDKPFSPDLFLYARCYVVAKGKALYEAVRKDPRRMPKDKDFEALLEVAQHAYERKTGRDWTYVSRFDYETFANEDGWSKS